MKIAQFETKGLPSEVLKLVDVPIPEPGQGEVRIKVATCNINPSDIMFIRGLYGIRPELPSSAGFEAAGEIDKCGDGVELSPGMRVIFSALGVWKEYVIIPAKNIIPTPEEMSDEVACQAFVNPFTAYGMLKESDLQKDQWLMLTAGGSAFGKIVVQMCKERGINTVCTVRREDQKEELLELGASAVVNTEKESLFKSVRVLTEKNGVDYVFDAVGGDLGARAMECLATNGTMIVFGLLSLENIPLNSGLVLFENLIIRGFWLSSWLSTLSTEEKKRVTSKILKMLANDQLKVNIEAKYPLDEVIKAIEHADSPGRKGKIILDLRM